jgi:uncharacterized protein involved in tolerance to divalent cations
VDAAACRLEEQRLAAYVDLAELELARGRHAALAVELRPLAEAHPLNERLLGQLMLALAGTGQQAEALHRYAALRTQLGEELGVEPGPEVAAIHVRVLRQQVPVATRPSGGPLVYATATAGGPPPLPPASQLSTTTNSREAARKLARSAVLAHVATDAQVVGPILSRYQWDGRTQDVEEWLIQFTASSGREGALRDLIIACQSRW